MSARQPSSKAMKFNPINLAAAGIGVAPEMENVPFVTRAIDDPIIARLYEESKRNKVPSSGHHHCR